MSDTVDYNSTAEWDADSLVLFFDWDTDQIVASDGSLVADDDAARIAAAQTPSGDPGSVSIPTDAASGLYYAYSYANEAAMLADDSDGEWGVDTGLRWTGTELGNPFLLAETLVHVTVTPAQANSSNPRYSTKKMANLAQGSAPLDVWTFEDGAGDPIDLSGKTVRLVFATVTDIGDDDDEDTNDPIDDTLTGAFKYETSGDGLTVGGDDDNQVTLQHDSEKLDTPGHYKFFWWNISDKIMLCKGSVDIEPAAIEV